MKKRVLIFFMAVIMLSVFSLQDLDLINTAEASTAGKEGVFNGHRYAIYTGSCKWEAAKEKCASMGGHLVTITSAAEQAFIEELNESNRRLWIGLYRDDDDVDNWKWITGEKVDYTNWDDGEPNNSKNVINNENRASVWPKAWNDLNQNNTYETSGFICEWEYSPNGHVYKVLTAKEMGIKSWEEAQEYCRNAGGHLATITSESENEQIYITMRNAGYGSAYFGLTDQGSQDSWRWVTGEPLSYTNWHEGEPNDPTEHYGMFYANFSNSKWNDGHCKIYDDTCFICEWDHGIPKNSYSFVVVDENGNPVADAEVEVDGKTYKSGSDGIVVVDGMLKTDDPKVSINANGYDTWSNGESNWSPSKKSVETVVMFKEEKNKEETIKLKQVIYSDSAAVKNSPKESVLTPNLLKSTKKLSLSTSFSKVDDGTFYIKAVPVNGANITEYVILQNKKQIATSKDGYFELNVKNFAEGKNVVLRTKGKNNKYLDTRLNLEFVKSVKNKESSFSLNGKEISFKVSEDTPYIGGQTVSVKMPISCPVTVLVSDDKVQIGINVNVDGKTSKEEQKEKLKKAKETLTDLRTVKKNAFKMMSSAKAKKQMKDLMKKNNSFKFLGDGSCNVLGYAEADLGSNTASGYMVITLELKLFECEYNTIVVVVPVTVQVSLTGSAEITGSITYNWEKGTLKGSLDVAPSFTLKAFAGVGVSKIVGVGVYGSAKLKGDISILPDTYVKSVDLTGDLGLKAYLAFLTYEKSFAYKTWHLYTANNIKSKGALLDELGWTDGLYDISAYKKADLSYLEQEKDHLGQEEKPELVSKSGNTKAEFLNLIENTYRNAQPVMISAKDTLYAAFLKADNDGRVYTVLSKYDGSNWSTAVVADAEAILDNAPCLCADGEGNIYLAYARTNSAYEADSISSYAKNQEIVVGTVDPETLAFTRKAVYPCDGYAHMQQLKIIGGKPTLVWAGSEITDDNSVLWSDKNRVYTATCDEDGWTNAEELASIDHPINNLTVGEKDGQVTVACVVDEDGDYSSTGDQNLYAINASGSQMLQEGYAGRILYGTLPGTEEAAFIWNSDGKVCTSANESLEVPDISNEFQIGDSAIFYSAASEEGAQLTMIPYVDGEWGVPVTVIDGTRYLENLNLVEVDGKQYVLGMNTAISIDEESVNDDRNLVFATISKISDLQVVDYTYDTDGLIIGEDMDVTLTIQNKGDHHVDKCIIYIDGEEYDDATIDLAPGEETDTVISMTCPAVLSEYTVTVLEKGWADTDESDNSYKFVIGYADLSVSAERKTIGKRDDLYIYVKNQGLSVGSGTLSLSNEKGDILLQQEIPGLEGGASTYCIYDLTSYVTSAAGEDLTVSVRCDHDDLYGHNNQTTYYYVNAFEPVFKLPAFITAIEAEAFAGTCFASVEIPEGVQSIESRAFADSKALCWIRIPDTVKQIAEDAFENCEDVIIVCNAGSFAETWATEHEYGLRAIGKSEE